MNGEDNFFLRRSLGIDLCITVEISLPMAIVYGRYPNFSSNNINLYEGYSY